MNELRLWLLLTDAHHIFTESTCLYEWQMLELESMNELRLWPLLTDTHHKFTKSTCLYEWQMLGLGLAQTIWKHPPMPFNFCEARSASRYENYIFNLSTTSGPRGCPTLPNESVRNKWLRVVRFLHSTANRFVALLLYISYLYIVLTMFLPVVRPASWFLRMMPSIEHSMNGSFVAMLIEPASYMTSCYDALIYL